jgi:hypothetical protein
LAYYFNWSRNEIMHIDHRERIKFCNEVSKINKKMNSSDDTGNKKNIFDIPEIHM